MPSWRNKKITITIKSLKFGKRGKMKQIMFSYKDTCLITEKELSKTAKRLKDEIDNVQKASQQKYEDERASIHAPFDKYALEETLRIIKEKKDLKPSYLVVVGIGGSNLGTRAVQEAIKGKLYNMLDPEIKILYADTTDAAKLSSIAKIIEKELKQKKRVIINGVSKSGSTTETIANFEILLEVLKKHDKNYAECIVVTTERESKFWQVATQNGYSTLENPKKVGGRYSVFTPVGLFPLGMIGVKIKDLLDGARTIMEKCMAHKWEENPAATSAIIRYLHYKKNRNINDMFLFKSDYESIGKWYRQLMGESIGKELNLKGKKVNTGITPTVSIGSTDLHSVGQLYLGGPKDKYTLFVNARETEKVKLPKIKEYEELVKHIQGIDIHKILEAILEGTKKAYKKGERPYSEIVIPENNEFYVGQLLQFFMIEMMYLGALMEVNPFDQPNVESYKAETREILQHMR